MKTLKEIILSLIVILVAYGSVTGIAKADGNKRVDMLATTLGYDIIKQSEELSNDPYDIKETDLRKFAYVCADASFQRKLNSNGDDFKTEVNDVCKIITSVSKSKSKTNSE